jgi:hypothetical protein
MQKKVLKECDPKQYINFHRHYHISVNGLTFKKKWYTCWLARVPLTRDSGVLAHTSFMLLSLETFNKSARAVIQLSAGVHSGARAHHQR